MLLELTDFVRLKRLPSQLSVRTTSEDDVTESPDSEVVTLNPTLLSEVRRALAQTGYTPEVS